MMAAPRFCTLVMYSPSIHAASVHTSLAGLPSTVAWRTSGYCVLEWLPQMMTPLTLSQETPHLIARCEDARLWSSRVSAEMFFGSTLGAARERMAAFVFAGLPTTTHLTPVLAPLESAEPCELKMPMFLVITSLRSIPSLRGNAPRKMA